MGVRDIRTDRNGPVVGVACVYEDDEVLMMTAPRKNPAGARQGNPHHGPQHPWRADHELGRGRFVGRYCPRAAGRTGRNRRVTHVSPF